LHTVSTTLGRGTAAQMCLIDDRVVTEAGLPMSTSGFEWLGAVLDLVKRSWSTLTSASTAPRGGAMADGSDCRNCGAAVPARASYCPECFEPSSLAVVDRAGVENGPEPAELPQRSHSRSGLVTGMAVLVGIAALLGWSLTRGDDPTAEAPLDPEAFEDRPDSVTSTTTSATNTTAASMSTA
jgi:hypothetical protein